MAYLRCVLRLLRDIHAEYYRQYDAHVASLQAVGADAGVGAGACAAHPLPLPSVPDIISRQLRSILADTCIVFSGVFPLGGLGGEDSRLWARALAFGASVAEAPDATRCRVGAFSDEDLRVALADNEQGAGDGGDVHASAAAYHALQRFGRRVTTHVVARTPGTAKVLAGAADPSARVVHLSWLEQCLLQYARLPEGDFAAALGPGRLAECAAREQAARVADLRELKRLVLAEAVARKRQEAALRLQQGDDEDEDEDEEDVPAAVGGEDVGAGAGAGAGRAGAAASDADGPGHQRWRRRTERDDGESVGGRSTGSSGGAASVSGFMDELEDAFGHRESRGGGRGSGGGGGGADDDDGGGGEGDGESDGEGDGDGDGNGY